MISIHRVHTIRVADSGDSWVDIMFEGRGESARLTIFCEDKGKMGDPIEDGKALAKALSEAIQGLYLEPVE